MNKDNTSTFLNSEGSPGYFGTSESPIMSSVSSFIDGILKYRVFSHLVFWLVLTIGTAYHGSLFGGTFMSNLTNLLAILPFQVLASYLFVYFQVQKWLFKGKWLFFGISIVVSAYFFSILARLSVIYVAEPFLGITGESESLGQLMADPIFLFKVYFISLYVPAFILFLIKMTKDRFRQQLHMDRLQKEKRTAELEFLKGQMNPHFLFNTLNNLYSMSVEGQSETSESILKLSDILHYTLYECSAPRVALGKEWELIENYADLEALRYGDKIDLLLNCDIQNASVLIAPLLLIAPVENAFKFSLKTKNDAPFIRINLHADKSHVHLNVENSKSEKNSATNVKSKESGIGVKNLRRQLQLIYPGQHSLELNNDEKTYSVDLKISLK